MTTARRHRAPDPAKVAEIRCPVERAAVVSRYARKVSWLPPDLSALRVAALAAAVAGGTTMVTLADACRVAPTKISDLLGRAGTGPDGAETEHDRGNS